ncbi:MAG TPA: hypothetical protein PKK60_03295 [archaeon]|nr:hypothetical protein [archaeon]
MKTKPNKKIDSTKVKKQKALILISGGFDSPVAGKLLENKFDLTAIHFSQQPFTDNTAEEKSKKICKLLGIKKLIIIDAGETLHEIAKNSYSEFYFLLMKRYFMQVSEKIAEKEKCEYLITGESLGQVSSQTASNLMNINLSTKIEILRPVFFYNKQEIIDKSKEFGFYEISKGPETCDVLAHGKVKTKSKIIEITREEEKCKMEEKIKKSIKKIRIEEIN